MLQVFSSPNPVLAASDGFALAEQQREEATAMLRSLESRGVKLPKLTSVPAQPQARGGSRAESASADLMRELKRENKQIQELRKELEASQVGWAQL